MKNVPSVIIALSILLLAGCESCEKEERYPGDFSYLNGQWVGSGYQCNGPQPDEQIGITWTAVSGIVAIKVTGDPCVNAGSVTFRGTYNAQTEQFDITWTTGYPTSAGCCTSPGTLKIIDDNTLEGSGSTGEVITFTR